MSLFASMEFVDAFEFPIQQASRRRSTLNAARLVKPLLGGLREQLMMICEHRGRIFSNRLAWRTAFLAIWQWTHSIAIRSVNAVSA